MRRILSVMISIALGVSLLGCGEKSADRNETHEPAVLQSRNIVSGVYESTSGLIRIVYPQIQLGQDSDTTINDLIAQEITRQMGVLTGADYSDLSIDLQYAPTIDTEELLCFLFEGKLERQGAAHPVNIGFSVCVDMVQMKIVDPIACIELNEKFVADFRESLQNRPENHPLDEEQWESVVQHIASKPDDELLNTLKSSESVIAVCQDGVVVLFPVAHAAGDYLKITVPTTQP